MSGSARKGELPWQHSYHTVNHKGASYEKPLADFMIRKRQHLLPMVELIEQWQMAVKGTESGSRRAKEAHDRSA
jgi:hypothetical protein